ncbi:protein NKG7 isoform X1 [Elephas maximus indicus]|uniref:protein NKG7 isoform X1 n=1 Tax=Elephas maximus indicus TaxID=99487 RepID=UPI0021161BEB|nr:protein NKG7 isoform X1 [Elephas maximus indicus]
MEPCRSLALFAGSLALVCMLVALSTNFWIVAIGPTSSAHTGLWPSEGSVAAGYIHVTEGFSIMAALWVLVSMVILLLSFFIPLLSAPGHGPLVSAITAFAAVLFMTVAMAVYTSERWGQVPEPHIQAFFGWSFYLGWVSVLFSLCAGALTLGAHCSARQSGYEAV